VKPTLQKTSSRTIAATAVFTALIASVTMAFSIFIPATKGYFDVGEITVYIAAMLMGPYVGAIAGGVGSAISDAILAPQYAPGTLVIKGLEGYIVGYLTRESISGLSRTSWRAASAGLGAVLGLLVGLVGVDNLSGAQQLTVGFPIGPQFNLSFTVPPTLWIIIGAATFALIFVVGLTVDEKVGWTTLAILIGGSEMVLGYFLYESIALNLGFVTASVEVPINAGQVLVGLLVALPLVRSIKRITAKAPAVKTTA
jgi:uncharacterized membrane protein